MKNKMQLLKAALTAGGDLGGKTVSELVGAMVIGMNVPKGTDPISAIIYNSILNAEDNEDLLDNIDNDLSYAIAQLEGAKSSLYQKPVRP